MLQKEIRRIKQQLLSLGGKVEENYDRAVAAVRDRDTALVEQVLATEKQVDEIEVEVEEECLKVLALHQPVARDLRFIVTALKVNNDLERIDDLSAKLAKHALFFVNYPDVVFPFDFSKMAEVTRTMLKLSLDSLVEMDQSMAMEVRQMDDLVDDMNREMYQKARERVEKGELGAELIFHAMALSRCFERIGDMSTNIAEDVIYLISGQIVRH